MQKTKYMHKNGSIPEGRQLELDVEQYLENYHARLVPGSGGGLRKGDVISDKYLVECKYTSKLTYILTGQIGDKIYHEAMNERKIPLFACRSQCGDFFVGSSLDFYDMISIDAPDLGTGKTCSIETNGYFDLRTNKTIMPIIIGSVDLKGITCE